jgi:hypothetical protein
VRTIAGADGPGELVRRLWGIELSCYMTAGAWLGLKLVAMGAGSVFVCYISVLSCLVANAG